MTDYYHRWLVTNHPTNQALNQCIISFILLKHIDIHLNKDYWSLNLPHHNKLQKPQQPSTVMEVVKEVVAIIRISTSFQKRQGLIPLSWSN